MAQRIILFLKGICMGFADVIPGVSGGTLALILGIYKEFVDTLRGLHLRWVPPLWRWLRSGFAPGQAKQDFRDQLATLNLPFLLTLVSGIATALLLGSLFIPWLIENHPVPTKAFFLGLIVASVYIPLRMIHAEGRGAAHWAVAGAMIALGTLAGYLLTNPASSYDIATTEFQATAQPGESLKDLTRRFPTSSTVEQVYWAPKNAPLRDAIKAADPKAAADLAALHALHQGRQALGKKELKARALPYQDLSLPQGTPVTLARPALWFVFVAGAVAICAMILPGISGSYILLIFGVYFFVLNSLKGMLSQLAQGHLPLDHILYVGVFILALILGILSFARLLSHLLAHHAAPTLGLLVGLMIGCLRGIWPFQQVIDGVPSNVLPGSEFPALGPAVATMILGFGLVVLLSVLGNRLPAPQELGEA